MFRRLQRLLGVEHSVRSNVEKVPVADVPERTQTVKIAERKTEGEGIISLSLIAVRGELAPWEAGSHVDVYLGHGLVRQYSLCNDPSDRDRYRLGILLEPASRGGSREIHERFHEGRLVQIGFPRNNFPLDEHAPYSILLGGGIGITPLVAMAYRLQTLGRPFHVHYCVRDLRRAAFAKELAARLGRRFLVHSDTDPAERQLDPPKHLAPVLGGRLYVCGPSGFIARISDAARALGWDATAIRTESFNKDVKHSGTPFRIRTSRSGIDAMVESTETILEVLEGHGVEVPVSCRQGVCGTCLVPVLEGIPDHRDVFQSEAEKATNRYITVCCSRAKSSLLVLDV